VIVKDHIEISFKVVPIAINMGRRIGILQLRTRLGSIQYKMVKREFVAKDQGMSQ
jgi:hypothetical protein